MCKIKKWRILSQISLANPFNWAKSTSIYGAEKPTPKVALKAKITNKITDRLQTFTWIQKTGTNSGTMDKGLRVVKTKNNRQTFIHRVHMNVQCWPHQVVCLLNFIACYSNIAARIKITASPGGGWRIVIKISVSRVKIVRGRGRVTPSPHPTPPSSLGAIKVRKQ
jgi:hypothetical protein